MPSKGVHPYRFSQLAAKAEFALQILRLQLSLYLFKIYQLPLETKIKILLR